jgi:hypothetical protein
MNQSHPEKSNATHDEIFLDVVLLFDGDLQRRRSEDKIVAGVLRVKFELNIENGLVIFLTQNHAKNSQSASAQSEQTHSDCRL